MKVLHKAKQLLQGFVLPKGPLVLRTVSPRTRLMTSLAMASALLALLVLAFPAGSASAGTLVHGTRTSIQANLGSTTGGGLQGEVNCDNGQYVHAIRVRHDGGNFISHMRFWCQSLTANTFTKTSTGEKDYYILNSNSEAGFQDLACGATSYVSGLRVVNNGWMDDLGVVCRDISTGVTTTDGPKFNQGAVNNSFDCPCLLYTSDAADE